MAYVNVAEWKTDQVCEWLKGLDHSIVPYVHSFMNHNVNGQQLLNLRPEDLHYLGVSKLGHQEVILEAAENLRNFHYDLDRENLQLLALHLSCQTHSLYNELSQQTDETKPVSTQSLSDVVAIIKAVKPLVRWLDRPPFSGQLDYNDQKIELLKLSLEMATCAQRDRFAEKPVGEIKITCRTMADLADCIIQDTADPMILQPSSLDLATLKKKPGDDLGFCILPSFHGAHQITKIKFGSAAHQCGKIEEGDELVQVNYQTVVGWERKNVLELFRESPAEVILTLKRRPRHTKVYGQIYIKPYRLPSNKKTPYTTRWQNNLPSPRPELLTIPDFTMPLTRYVQKAPTPKPISVISEVSVPKTMNTDDSSDTDSELESPSSVRLSAAKPRNVVHRRATITGASPAIQHSSDLEQFWRKLKQERITTFQLCNRAVSCTHGLDDVRLSTTKNLTRPQTCLGIELRIDDKVNYRKISDLASVELQNHKLEQSKEQLHDQKNKVFVYRSIKPFNTVNRSENINIQLDKENYNTEKNTKTVNVEVLSKKTDEDFLYLNLENDSNESQTVSSSPQIIQEKYKHDKRCHTLTSDLTESDEDFIEKKFEAALDEHHKLQRIERIRNWSRKDSRKTDSPLFDSFEDLVEPIESSKCTINHPNLVNSKIYGNVAKKIEVIEKSLQNDSSERVLLKSSMDSDILKMSICTVINENPNVTLHRCQISSENIKTDLDFSEATESIKISQNLELKRLPSSILSEGCQNETSGNSSYPMLAYSNSNFGSENSKILVKQKTENNIQQKQMPPEPPLRKYFTNKIISNFNLNQQQREKPTNTNRSSNKRDFEKVDVPLVDYTLMEKTFNENIFKKKSVEVFCDSVENSAALIEKLSKLRPETKNNNVVDQYGYTERPGDDPTENIPCIVLKTHKRNNSIAVDEGELDSCRIVSSDTSLIEPKHESLDKGKLHDKGVVNKAITVARSMALHGNFSKSISSPRSTRKKSIILAKRRNVTVKEVTPGNLEGWLTYRSRGAGGAWAQAWFVIYEASLYRFKTQNSLKADCQIALSEFTAAPASEVKSRKYAFKVYYSGTVFYFAADNDDMLVMWLDSINKASLGGDKTSDLFTDTDESDEEIKTKSKTIDSKQKVEKTFGSLKKFSKKNCETKENSQDLCGASLDRKYLKFLSSKSQIVPVPTAQFRSYRRVLPASAPERSRNYTHRPDELQDFVTLEEFMLSRQEENCQCSSSLINYSFVTTPNNDHNHFKNQMIAKNDCISQINNLPRYHNDLLLEPPLSDLARKEPKISRNSFNADVNSDRGKKVIVNFEAHQSFCESNFVQERDFFIINNHNNQETVTCDHYTSDISTRLKSQAWIKSNENRNTRLELDPANIKNEGPPRLHQSLFRSKSSHQTQNRQPGKELSQSHNLHEETKECSIPKKTFRSVNFTNDRSPDAATTQVSKCMVEGIPVCPKNTAGQYLLMAPTFPFIPPPALPPPDYPNLEYPPVFEPGTYSLSDASFFRSRNFKNN